MQHRDGPCPDTPSRKWCSVRGVCAVYGRYNSSRCRASAVTRLVITIGECSSQQRMQHEREVS